MAKRGRTWISGNTGKYFGEYKNGGRDTVLGLFHGQVGPGMSGGCIYARDPDLADKLHKDVTIASVMRECDYDIIRQDLTDFFEATGDRQTRTLLDNWETEKVAFQKIVAKKQYADKLFEYLYNKLGNHPYSEEDFRGLLGDLLEMCGLDADHLTDPSLLERLRALIRQGIDELQAIIGEDSKAKDEDEIETRFKLTKRFATEFAERVCENFKQE